MDGPLRDACECSMKENTNFGGSNNFDLVASLNIQAHPVSYFASTVETWNDDSCFWNQVFFSESSSYLVHVTSSAPQNKAA